MMPPHNIDDSEIDKFSARASRWWDPEGELKTLHDINPLRVRYINERTPLKERRILDVGCGGGILAEAMAELGASVTAIDASDATINIAKLHLHESGLSVDYQVITAESLLETQPATYDIVTCLELLEHVPDPTSIVNACAQLVKPGGAVYFSTINRNPKAYVQAVLAAEYILRMLPRGTHDYARFIKPSELAGWSRYAGLELLDLTGLHYNPLLRSYSLGSGIDVNYMAHFTRDFE